MVTPPPPIAGNEAGFSLVELLIVAFITSAVVGSAVMLAGGVQRSYASELDDAAVQQEGRYALDWITQAISSAGSNPYDVSVTNCPSAGTAFAALRLDPDGDGQNDDIRIQADTNPPNGLVLGDAGACNEAGEDVTIAHDAVNLTITRRDRATDIAPMAVTDGVFTGLTFTYLDASRAVTAAADSVAYVQVLLTARSRTPNTYTNQFSTYTFASEVRLRAR